MERVGAVYALMKELTKKGLSEIALIIATGKTIAENLANVVNRNPEVIRPFDEPFSQSSGIAVLKGNLAKDGCMFKQATVAPEMMKHEGPKGGPGMCEMLTPDSAICGMGLDESVALSS